MNKSIRRCGLAALALAVLLSSSGCEQLALKTLISIRTQGGVCVSVDTGSDDNPGTPDEPKQTIEAAIEYLDQNGFIASVLVAEGVYSYDYQSGNYLTVVEGVSLYGGYSTDFSKRDPDLYVTTISDASSSGGLTSNPNRPVQVPQGVSRDTVIDGFTILGGGGTISAAVFCQRSSPTISNNRIDAGSGSGESYGVYCYQSGANPRISNNREIRGGDFDDTHAIYNTSGASPVIEGNYIHGGDGSNTYAIHNSTNCSSTIASNNVHGGDAANRAYAVYCEYSSPNIWNNTIFGGEGASVASNGIGCYHTGTAKIYNNTIDGGSGAGSYGIRYGDAPIAAPSGNPCTPDIRNNIITISNDGSCIFEYNSTGENAVAVQDNDLWDRGGATYYSYQDIGGSNYQGSDIGTFNELSFASGNISENPEFVDRDGAGNDITYVLDNDWHLDSGSPFSVTVGGQTLSGSFTQDKDGNDRTGSWSMGAYEFDPF